MREYDYATLDDAPLFIRLWKLTPKQLKMLRAAEQAGSVLVERRDEGTASRLRSLGFLDFDAGDIDRHILTSLGRDALRRALEKE